MDRPRILIAGAGIGGLTAALALLRRGFPVEVHEQAAELREIGAGVQISANGMRCFDDLGVAAEIAAAGAQPERREIRLWNTAEAWTSFDLAAKSMARYGQPYVTLYRPDLLAILAAAVERAGPGTVRLGRRAVGCEQDSRGVALRFADGTTARGDVLVGADGIHSAVRAALHGPDRPEYSGMVAWRGVLAREAVPAAFRAPVAANWVGPGRHVVHYPLRGGALLNVVGVVERATWPAESWTTPGTQAEFAADFAGWHADLHALIRAIAQPFVWALMRRPPLERWTAGRVTLLGDACHPTLPFMAQGAVMAVEDGVVLARALDEGGADLPAALARYEAARRERTARVVAGSAANAGRFHNRALADPQAGRDYIARELAAAPTLERFDWLYRYDALAVPI